MNQTAKILKMKSLGFTLDQIAIQLGLSMVQLREVIGKDNKVLKKKARAGRSDNHLIKKDRPTVKRNQKEPVRELPMQEMPRAALEVKPGFYVLAADDLLSFASKLQEQLAAPPDPYQDYVQKDVFQEQYGISDTTLQRHQKEGLLVVYKQGNKQYLKKSQVVEALEKGKL